MDEIVTEIITMVPRDVPEYARPMEGRFGMGLHRGVAIAMQRFLELPGTAEPALGPDSRRVYAELGRGSTAPGGSSGRCWAPTAPGPG
ncbi:hypothetical protein [Arsenicicoccus dermatophilus]|uniref:hypothetical protein n=1 Tax=Arsenicicoccus dermatophilus TaxID=1076331 RepID=UPI001F4D356D|nr:hypothetical protein [Arsenicicoccus dermatophilus]MCH8612218.1 hypothetical protein [Arsenicicoccus dermatophilus]